MALVELPKPPKPQDPADAAYRTVKNMDLALWREMEKKHTEEFNFMWKNPQGIDIEEFLKRDGKNGESRFKISAAIQGALKEANPDYKMLLPLKQVYFPGDGSATTVAP